MPERQKYLRLLSIIIEELPISAIDAAIKDAAIKVDYQAPASMLSNVRIGRVHNLEHLVALVRHGLPKYLIPAELLA